MFIRKKSNKGGSFSILLQIGERIADKKYPVSRTIKNFGSARGHKQITALTKQAETYKARLETLSPKPQTLKISSDLDMKSCRSFNTGFSDIYGQAFNNTFASLTLKPNLINQLRDLVIMRVAAPASKLRTTQLSAEYGIECKVDSIYKLMDQITEPAINEIKKIVYEHTTQLLTEQKKTIDVLFYDLTTIYFETSSQDEIRDFGFSKDGKHQHVQIMLAAIVTTDGLPIDYQEFPGNFYEGHTLIPALNEIKKRYEIGKVVLVADAALMNKINLQELDKRNIKYIIAARIKNANKSIKQAVFDISNYKSISKTIESDGGLKEEIKAKILDSGDGDFLIAYHSTRGGVKVRATSRHFVGINQPKSIEKRLKVPYYFKVGTVFPSTHHFLSSCQFYRLHLF
ncbi:MAG: IS1634 family transposase [Patescibacteria group bacterium]